MLQFISTRVGRAIFIVLFLFGVGIIAFLITKVTQPEQEQNSKIVGQLATVTKKPVVSNTENNVNSSTEAPSPADQNDALVSQTETALPETITSHLVAVGPGIGIMGGSNSDEYRADDQRGGRDGPYSATTLNWMEQLVLRRGLNFGPWGKWGNPRRTGYKYNWARSGATTDDLIRTGQHSGLAQQVANGEVAYVFIFVGSNDLLQNNTARQIYRGEMDETALQATIAKIVSNITTAVDTILTAGDAKVVVSSLSDMTKVPEMASRFSDADGRQRLSEAIGKINSGLQTMATDRNVTLLDVDAVSANLFSMVNENGILLISDEQINARKKGNEPHHLQLGDQLGHAGTVFSGLMANSIFLEPFNTTYSLNVSRLTDEEILQNAGILPPPVPTILHFSATLPTIRNGESTTLQWETDLALKVSIDNEIGYVPATGSVDVSPVKDTTYTITTTGPGGTNSTQTTVSVTTNN